MPILETDIQPSEPQKAPPKVGGIIESDIAPPSWGEVLAGIPERTGLSFVEAAGGGAQAIGDLLRIDSLADLGADIARTARGAAEMSQPGGMTGAQQIVSGGLESALQMAPVIGLAGVSGGASLAPVGIGLAAAQTGASRYADLREKDFGGGQAAFVASIDGLFEALGEKVALPVLSDAAKPWVRRTWEFMARDMAGEQFTTIGQQVNAMFADRPDMTLGEFLDGMKTTALVTPIAAGGQIGMALALQAAVPPTPPEIQTPPETSPSGPQPLEPPPAKPADPYAEYAGKTVSVDIETEGPDGIQVSKFVLPADKAMRDIDGRISAVELLAKCLNA